VYSRDHYIRGYYSISDSSTSNRIDNEETGFLYDNKIGPLWLGKLHDKEILKKVLEKGNEKIGKEKGSERSMEKLLRTAIEEVDLPGFHDTDSLSSLFRKEQPKIDCLVEKLRDEGYMASRTIFSPKGIKTDAPLKEIEKHFSG
jgi:tRNA (guanine26-N2/guanine27-N2)-dimethyltransferase